MLDYYYSGNMRNTDTVFVSCQPVARMINLLHLYMLYIELEHERGAYLEGNGNDIKMCVTPLIEEIVEGKV